MVESPLPKTDPELVHQMQGEYDAAFRNGSQADLEAARFRMVWAMVHSTDLVQVSRGLELAKLRLADTKVPAKDQRELQYLVAVGCYNLSKYVEARRVLKQVLLTSPDFRQAELLQATVDDKIMKEGLIGMGIGAAVIGVGLAVLFGSARK